MTYFEERFKNHVVHSNLSKCLEEVNSHGLESLSVEEMTAINRCKHVFEFSETMIKKCDCDLVHPAILSAIDTRLKQFLGHGVNIKLIGSISL